MKKIDLHIHTIATISDSHFDFNLQAFKDYVEVAGLDAVAITNHDVFNSDQYRLIKAALKVPVFPGIEINLAKGHLLLISNDAVLDDFQSKCDKVSARIQNIDDYISFEEMVEIFGDLRNYLLIPHADKNPEIGGNTLQKLLPYISAGEVASSKKFIYAIKNPGSLTPVLFSDVRIHEKMNKFVGRQTYIDCTDITLDAIKSCLLDKSKVALSPADGNELVPIFENGQMLSTGLNILLGERSSGKTYTLEKIRDRINNPKYIAQFALVQQSEASEKDFTNEIENNRSIFVDGYLSGFKAMVDEVINIDLHASDVKLDAYLQSLLKSAAEADRQDAYSKTVLFGEPEFSISESKSLKGVIDALAIVFDNLEYREIIEKHVQLVSLRNLACELILQYRAHFHDIKKKRLANEIIKDIKAQLKMRTSATQVEDFDFVSYSLDCAKVKKFDRLTNSMKTEATIRSESIQGFRIESKRSTYARVTDIKNASRTTFSFKEAHKCYDQPYRYLRELLNIEGLSHSDIYKLFVKISYRILNRDGFEVSGGERSEFRLLQQIRDAQNYDMLLIDEPESSFDNLFLKSDVNQILKDISLFMPVVIVTHNNTVGASIGADYILYAKKEMDNGAPQYRLYSGRPSDKTLNAIGGGAIDTHAVLMNSLEAGIEAYEGRKTRYENIKN